MELEELKRQLLSKSFALDEVIPLARRAAQAIERLQAENLALCAELQRCKESDSQLKTLVEAIGRLIAEKSVIDTEQAYQRLTAAIGNVNPFAEGA